MTDELNRTEDISRRVALQRLGPVGSGAYLAGAFRSETADIIVGGKPVEIAVWSLSPTTVRITVSPMVDGARTPVPVTGALAVDDKARPVARGTEPPRVAWVRARDVVVRFSESPPSLTIETARGDVLQRLGLSAETSEVSFLTGQGPLLGFGERGAQFDRKGVVDKMRNGPVSN